MGYTYRRKNRWGLSGPTLVALGATLFPLSVANVDFRSGFGRGLAISTRHSSPAFAALEDLRADFEPTPDLAGADLPELNAPERAAPSAPIARQVAARGVTIHRAAEAPTVVLATSTTPVIDLDQNADAGGATLAERARTLVRRELTTAAPERVIASALGTHIIVRGQTQAPPPRGARAASVAITPKFATIDDAGVTKALWLDGQVEMTGGLAFTGPDTALVIKRMLDGRTLETGRIWITEGRFEIKVSRPTGRLVAELQSPGGRVFGRGEVNLTALTSVAPREPNRIGDIRIALRPTAEFAQVRAISAYSHRQYKLAATDAKVDVQSASQALEIDAEGVASEPTLGPGSTFLARAEAPGHRPSLAVASVDRPREVRLLSDAMADALIELERRPTDQAPARAAGLVWGEVRVDDRTVAGATVELDGGSEPIYFNDLYLPDRTLTATSANGLFAFLDVTPGVRAARVTHVGRGYPAEVFAAEPAHVSIVDFDLRDDAIAQFRVVDAVDERRPVAAELRVVGGDARANVRGDDAIALATAGAPVMIEAVASPEYAISRATVPAEAGEITVPLVKRAWLNEMYALKNVRPADDRGAVVGFVADDEFTVEMTGAVLGESVEIVYFDRAGRPTTTGTGAAGGGFAILNAPPGLQTVRLRPLHRNLTHGELVVSEPNLVHVVHGAM